jgi:outer membrane protein assembly factor BamE
MIRKVLAATAAIWLAGCTTMEIEQGNYLTAAQVQRLETGMDRQQVRQAVGEPLLTDPFHPQRWDYVFRLEDTEGRVTRRRLTVHFNDRQQVERIETAGDAFPEGYAPESAS